MKIILDDTNLKFELVKLYELIPEELRPNVDVISASAIISEASK